MHRQTVVLPHFAACPVHSASRSSAAKVALVTGEAFHQQLLSGPQMNTEQLRIPAVTDIAVARRLQ